MNSTSFQGLENQKTLEIFWYKEEEEVQRDLGLVNDCKRLIEKVFKIIEMQNKALLLQTLRVWSRQPFRRVITFRKT